MSWGVSGDAHGTRWLLAGVAVVLLATVGPAHAWADRRLSGHMLQHVTLLTVAAPLLAVGLARRSPGTAASRWWAWLGAAVAAQAVVTVGWHAPALFEAADRHTPLHLLEHATFLLTAVLFWRAVVATAERGTHGFGVLAVFVAILPGTALGVAMTLASSPWYDTYDHATRAAAVSDQQVAGVVMWAGGGLAMIVAALALFAAWLTASERTTPARMDAAARR